jgi:hypothetical protein
MGVLKKIHIFVALIYYSFKTLCYEKAELIYYSHGCTDFIINNPGYGTG